MILIVGLGNIGKKYTYNRHNLGFLLVDRLIKKYSLIKESNKFSSYIYKAKIFHQTVLIIKPTTMMNLSGVAVSKVKNFYKVPLEKIFIFHDDLDLKLGRLKIKNGGSSGGHNGIRSIDKLIGNDYNRVRFGIGNPKFNNSISEYVLSDFNKEEIDFVMKKIGIMVDNLALLFESSFDNFIKDCLF